MRSAIRLSLIFVVCTTSRMARRSTSSMSRSGSSLSLSNAEDPREVAEDSFCTLIMTIADELDKQDVVKIRYLNKRCLGAGRHKLSTLEILEKLEEKGIFSFDCVLPLKQLLRRVGRIDLVRSVESYAEAHSNIVRNSVQGLERACTSCSSLLTHTTPIHTDYDPESHGETTSLLSCPSDLGAMAAQPSCAVFNQSASQESLEDMTEPHSKSLLVSRNIAVEYSVPDRRATSLNLPSNRVSSAAAGRSTSDLKHPDSILNVLPPPFLTRNTSGTQISSVQCSQTESIKPLQDTITTLQDNLDRIGIINGDTKVEQTDVSNPAVAKHSWASIEQPCPPSPLSKIKSACLARQGSQASQCSTVKANSSRSNSPASDFYATPSSSPLPSSRMEHASGKVNSKPTQCTEASFSEHRATGEDWQTHSIKYIQGADYIVPRLPDENQYPPSPSRSDNHRFEVLVRSQPIPREAICKAICRLDQKQDSIAFQEQLIFSRGPKLKLWLDPWGTGKHCSLNTVVTIAKQHWPQSDPSFDITLFVSVVGNNGHIIQEEKEHNLTIEQHYCRPSQKFTIPKVIAHEIITHDITDSFLLFVIRAKICHDQFSFHIVVINNYHLSWTDMRMHTGPCGQSSLG